MHKADFSSLTDSQQRMLLARLLQERSQDASRFPMSYGQQGLWHAYRRDRQLTAFSVFLPTRIRGPLNPAVLRQSINWVAQRHSALRTTFTDSESKLTQIVHQSLLPEFAVHQLPGVSDEQIRQLIDVEVRRPFCLERGPLLRVIVYQIADDDWVVLANTHHIIVDFWSLVIILSELRAAYPAFASGGRPELPPPVDNYREFVHQQQSVLASDFGLRLSQFWQKELQGASVVLELPTDFARPAAFSHQAASQAIRIEPETARRVVQLASQLRSTPFAVVHSAVQVLLQRYSRQQSFFIGSPFSGRSNQKFEQTVGFFINMLPVKADPAQDRSFSELVRQTTLRLTETLDHESMPISLIVQQAAIPRDPSRSPLFQVSCTFERAQKREELGRAGFLFPNQTKVFEFAGMRQESFYISHPTCHYDLEFVFEHSEDGLAAMLIYCRDIFRDSSMQQMSDNFSSLLGSLLQNSELPLEKVPWDSSKPTPIAPPLDNRSSPQSADSPNSSGPITNIVGTSATVHGLMIQAATKFPNHTAMECPQANISYREMSDWADRICKLLSESPTGSNTLIPVLCRQGMNAFVAMLGIQLAGRAVVPIDMTQPSTGIDRIVSELKCKWLLSDCAEELIESQSCGRKRLSISLKPSFDLTVFESKCCHQGEQQPSVEWKSTTDRLQPVSDHRCSGPDSLAYMIYTSGSTGEPKGVLIEHRSVCNTLLWRSRSLPLTNKDRVLMLLSHQFDAALGIGWSALTQGATLVWPDLAAKLDPTLLLQQIRDKKITILPIVPSFLRVLVQHPDFDKCQTLRAIWTGGEPLPPELPVLIRSKLPVRVWNLYGPTEAAIEATAVDVTDHSPNTRMTIGLPIDSMQVLIVDSQTQLVPNCVPGEIAISGPGLARGYFCDSELTAKRFVASPILTHQRMYLTGDLGRKLPSGQIEFLGRLDNQIKLRGYRIELGEIESVIQSHPLVDRAAVTLHTTPSGNSFLVAYVSLVKSGSQIVQSSNQFAQESSQASKIVSENSNILNEFLSVRLPPYKRPSHIIILRELPLTSSGKVDRKRLPTFQLDHPAAKQTVPARNELEQSLVALWCQELSIESLGIHQNFFEAGGSSLQAALVTTKLSNQLGVHVPTALLFDQATIAQIAQRLTALYPDMIRQRFGQAVVEFYSRSSAWESGMELAKVHPLLAPLKPSGFKTPLFMVHPPGGIVLCYRELAKNLPESQPLWAIRSRGLHGNEPLPSTMTEMAADYLQAIRTVQPKGPYLLGGWSLGGLVAYEMARQLLAAGDEVLSLVLLDTTIPEGATELVPQDERVNVGLEYGIELTLDQLGSLSADQQLPMLYEHAAKLGILSEQSAPEVVERVLKDLQQLFSHHVRLSRDYRLQPIATDILLLRPKEIPYNLQVTEDRGWRHLVSRVRVCFVSGHHHSMVQAPHAQQLAHIIAAELQ